MVDLMQYLPDYYDKSKVMRAVQQANEIEVNEAQHNYVELINQFNIDTATWGLERYEKEYGIDTDKSRSYEERRTTIKTKMCIAGACTISAIREIAIAFSGGDAEIIEHPEKYSFTIKFIGTKGVPINLDSFSSVIDVMKPAHLIYDYEFIYNAWDYIQNRKLTWKDVSVNTWLDLRVLK